MDNEKLNERKSKAETNLSKDLSKRLEGLTLNDDKETTVSDGVDIFTDNNGVPSSSSLKLQTNPTKYHYRQLDKNHEEERAKNIRHQFNLAMCNKPMSWNFALKCFFAGEMSGYRKKEVEIEYSFLRGENEWEDIESQIKSEVPHKVHGDTKKFYVSEPINEDARILIKNKYPYYYESDVTNWVFWLGNQNAGDEEIKSWIEGHEQLRKYDLIVYENSQLQKSVKGIRHLQILARETTDEERSIYFHTNNYRLKLYLT